MSLSEPHTDSVNGNSVHICMYVQYDVDTTIPVKGKKHSNTNHCCKGLITPALNR